MCHRIGSFLLHPFPHSLWVKRKQWHHQVELHQVSQHLARIQQRGQTDRIQQKRRRVQTKVVGSNIYDGGNLARRCRKRHPVPRGGIFVEQRCPTGRWMVESYYGAEATSPPLIVPSAPKIPRWLAPLYPWPPVCLCVGSPASMLSVTNITDPSMFVITAPPGW